MSSGQVVTGLRRVSSKELAGPCPFGQGGDDRFRVWADTGNCYCRYDCVSCPMVSNTTAHGGRKGWLQNLGLVVPGEYTRGLPSKRTVYAKSEDLLALADEFYAQLWVNGVKYLESRGIFAAAVKHFRIGQNGQRVIFPNIFNRKSLRYCTGIKGRWIGEKPDKSVKSWWAFPGSNGRRLYNANMLFGSSRDVHVLVVESTIEPPMLMELGIVAVSVFAGGSAWDDSWASFFVGRKVFIVEDQDEGGRKYAAIKARSLPWAQVVQPPMECKDLGQAYMDFGPGKIKEWYAALCAG